MQRNQLLPPATVDRYGGLIDFTEATVADRQVVADARDVIRNGEHLPPHERRQWRGKPVDAA